MASVFKVDPVFEDSGFHLMARIMRFDGNVSVSGEFASINLSVWDVLREWYVVEAQSLTISSVFYDTLQTDARWTKDATGYNFRYATSVSSLIKGESEYRFEFNFVPSTPVNNTLWVTYNVPTIDLRRS